MENPVPVAVQQPPRPVKKVCSISSLETWFLLNACLLSTTVQDRREHFSFANVTHLRGKQAKDTHFDSLSVKPHVWKAALWSGGPSATKLGVGFCPPSPVIIH